MTIKTTLGSLILLVTVGMLGAVWNVTPAIGAETTTGIAAGCDDAPSRALADVADALTSGSDGAVLSAALNNHMRLLRCGQKRQAISSELIAADAYGDVNQPKRRCNALYDARTQSLKLGDAKRARLIERSLRSC